MVPQGRSVTAAGRCARRLLLCLGIAALASPFLGAAGSEPDVAVTESGGLYRVAARFIVPQSRARAIAVLMDFERIPEYVPEIKSSTVIGRSNGVLIVEQAAVAKFMMFSKAVHLVLHVAERDGEIQFIDRCGSSFDTYQGSWTVVEGPGGTTITYALAARPAFDVPGFVLRRLMKRDAQELIVQLTRAIATP